MPVKKFKPTTNALRQMSTLDNNEITKSTPEKSLVGKKHRRNVNVLVVGRKWCR